MKTISIIKEKLKDERRVIITPEQVKELTSLGYVVLVEHDAGLGCNYCNIDYENNGGKIVDTDTAWTQADIILKYKAPIPEEYKYFRKGLNICALFHAESNERLIKEMCESRINAYTFEFLKTKDDIFPMAKSGGEIAGKFSVIMGTYLLQKQFGGSGKFLVQTRGVKPCTVGVIGYGNVGAAAIKLASDLGAKVICFGRNVAKMNKLSISYNNNVSFVESNQDNFKKYLPEIDLLIGSILISTYDTPPLIEKDVIGLMKKGSVVIDVTCGYGKGYLPFIEKYTTLEKPYYEKDGLIFSKIDNLPSAYPVTTVEAYTNNGFPYIKDIVNYISGDKTKEDFVMTSKIIEDGNIIHPVIKQHMEFYGN